MIHIDYRSYQCLRDGCGWRCEATDNLAAAKDVGAHLKAAHGIDLAPKVSTQEDALKTELAALRSERDQQIDMLKTLLAEARAERDQLRTALAAIAKALSPEADGEYWTVRKWLDQHDIYHDDLSGIRVVYEAAKAALAVPKRALGRGGKGV